MLSDEEKQAIEYLKSRLYGNEGCKFIDVAQSDLRIFLKLVENLQKEYQKLKMQLEIEKIDNKYNKEEAYEETIPRYRIRAKIEEFKKQIEKMEKDDIGVGFTLGKEWSDLKAKVEFGQSLLEKE